MYKPLESDSSIKSKTLGKRLKVGTGRNWPKIERSRSNVHSLMTLLNNIMDAILDFIEKIDNFTMHILSYLNLLKYSTAD